MGGPIHDEQMRASVSERTKQRSNIGHPPCAFGARGSSSEAGCSLCGHGLSEGQDLLRKGLSKSPAATYSERAHNCRNLIFRRNLPIHKLFERSCDLGLLRLTPDKITQIFGFRLTKRLRGKLQTLLEQVEHGHHVFRACAKSAVLRMYEKCSTFLRLEVLSNRLTDFRLGKSLDNLDAVRQTLAAVTHRFASFEASALNVHIDFPLFQRLALPVAAGRTKIPGIKIHDTRMIRLIEALLP